MAKQILLKSTANGTDYVMVQMILDGKITAKFGSKIKPVKAMIDAGFLGTQGVKALTDYIAEHGKDKILGDMQARLLKNADLDW